MRRIFCFLFLLICAGVASQTPTSLIPGGFRRMLVTDGIPSSEVYESYQDKAGYLWLATDAGICRYNGVTFTTYTTLNGLPDNTVFHIREDSEGKIWVQTFTGEISYFKDNRFWAIDANPSLMQLYGNGQKTQYTFFVNENDDIIVGGLYVGGCYSILKKDNYGSLKQVEAPFALPAARQLWTDDKGNWYAIGEGLYANDPYAEVLHNGHHVKVPVGYSMSVGINMRVLRSKDNHLYFSHRETVYEVDTAGNVKEHEFPGPIIGIVQDLSGDIWVTMMQEGTIRFADGNLSNPGINYLKGYSVSYVLQDAERGYWFTTVGKGVFYRAGLEFSYCTVSEGLPPYAIGSMMPLGKDRVFLGQAFCTITLISARTGGTFAVRSGVIGKYDEISVEALGVFNGKLYSNTDLTYYNDTSLRPIVDGAQRHLKGSALHPGGDTLLGFSHSSVVWMDKNLKIIKTCLAPERIVSACYQGNVLWLGGLTGLWRCIDTTIVYFGDQYAGLDARIDDMVTDGDGRLWISTRGDGVFVLDNDTVHHFDKNAGLSSNTCRSIARDEKDNIWVASNHGISVISDYNRFLGTANINRFDITDGLLSDEVNFIEVKESTVWMAGPEGICWVPTNKLLINLTPPPVYINSIIIANDTLPVSDSIVLDYADERIRIICEGVSLRNASKVSFRYKLVGSIDYWITTEIREITFSNLAPGDYTFILYALNGNGIPSLEPAVIQIHVNTPFTQTWWFYTLIVLGILIVLFIIARYRANIIRKKAAAKSEEEQRMSELRLSALRAQMNPHFIFNAINSIQHYILNKDSDKAYGYLAKFSKLIRLVLDQSQSKTITLKQELEILGLYLELEKLRFEKPITVSVNVPGDIDQSGIRLPGMLIQPYVENAIWHGLLPLQDRDGVLTINITEEGENLTIAIEDNGVGRAASDGYQKDPERRSYGMLITSERLKLMGRTDFNVNSVAITDLRDESDKPTGTRVEITIGLANFED